MKYGILFTLSLLILQLSCEKKDKDSYLWAIALLNSSQSEEIQTPEETPNPESSFPTKIHFTVFTGPETKGLCPSFGGLFVQYKRGEEETCSSTGWEPSCVSYLYSPDGSIKMIDARSFVGLSFNEDLEMPSQIFPTNSTSNLLCFKQMMPTDNDHVEMYSFQLQAIKKNQTVCEGTWNDTQCVDSIPIFGTSQFLMPKEFPIVTTDGDGHVGSQTLNLKFVSEENFYTTCTFFGNEHRKLEGFTWNAYIAGTGEMGDGLGMCRQCESNYCESIDPNSGLAIQLIPERMFPIPVGNIITAKKEIIFHVVKGQGPGKHSVRWNIQAFRQWVGPKELLVMLSNSNVLFVFLFPILLTVFIFLKQFWKKRIKFN